MKRSLKKIFALGLVLALCLGCVGMASAAEEYINEVTDVAVASGYTVSFGEEAVDGKYSNIEKFTLTFTGTAGTEYVVFLLNGENNAVPANGNIRYIDQKSGETTMEFTVYPDDLTAPGDYALHIATGSDYIEDVVTFKIPQPPYTLGDVDDSGLVDLPDAVLILKHIAELTDLGGTQFNAADVNKDGVVDLPDAVLVMKYIAELISSF